MRCNAAAGGEEEEEEEKREGRREEGSPKEGTGTANEGLHNGDRSAMSS